MLQIKQEDFLRLVDFVKKNYGINLIQKKHLIESRLGNMIASMGFTEFKQYVDHIISSKDDEDLHIMINRLTTNHTYFMREVDHFDFFRDTILPEIEKSCRNRAPGIWSAGCSSGEEPYTLSMILLDYFGGKVPPWDTRVLATDISRRVLQTAMQGSYHENDMKDVPQKWLHTYYTKKDQNYTVTKKLRDNVIYKEFNLMNPISFKIPFDVIFCRNVMIYFDQPTKDNLIRRFCGAMKPGGYLIIGHSETLNQSKEQMKLPFEYIRPSVYRKLR